MSRGVRVLVTGSSGFIGRALCADLVRRGSYEVHGLDRMPPPEPIPEFQFHLVDLTDDGATRRTVGTVQPETIVHLAAQTQVVESLADPAATYHINVDGTINLLGAARSVEDALDRFVLLSSETVYGPSATYPTPEDSILNPSTPYAASKAACELLVRQGIGDCATILRSAHTFGPHLNPQVQMVGRFIRKALRNESIVFPEGVPPGQHPTRDLNFLSNLLDGIRLGMEKGRSGTYNIGSGRETSSLELAQKVVAAAGSGKVTFSPTVSYRFGEAGLRTWLDISRARIQLGYQPVVALEEGLDRTIAWFRSVGLS